MRITKNDMARVIVAALYNLPALPPADHFKVTRMAGRSTVAELRDQHKRAMAVINQRVAGSEIALPERQAS